MKLIKYLIALVFIFMCSACFVDSNTESYCDINGHTWIEATTTSPKTCSVCNKTEGEPLQSNNDFEILKKALNELRNSSFTANYITDSTEEGEVRAEFVYEYSDNYLKLSEEEYLLFIEMKEQMAFMFESDHGKEYNYVGKILLENTGFEIIFLNKDFNQNTFSLVDGIYIGSLEEINKLYSGYCEIERKTYEELLSSMLMDEVKVNASFKKFNLKLENNQIKNLVIEIEIAYVYENKENKITLSLDATYSKIGETKVNKPSNLPSIESNN